MSGGRFLPFTQSSFSQTKSGMCVATGGEHAAEYCGWNWNATCMNNRHIISFTRHAVTRATTAIGKKCSAVFVCVMCASTFDCILRLVQDICKHYRCARMNKIDLLANLAEAIIKSNIIFYATSYCLFRISAHI